MEPNHHILIFWQWKHNNEPMQIKNNVKNCFKIYITISASTQEIVISIQSKILCYLLLFEVCDNL